MWRFFQRSSSPAPVAADAEVVEPALVTHAMPRATIILLGLAGATVTVFGLSAMRGVFAPVAFALVLTICAHPIRAVLERRSVPRGVATVTAILLVFALLAGFVAAFIVALTQFTTLIPEYAPQIIAIGQDVAEWLASIGVSTASAETIVSGFDPANLVDFATGILGGITGIIFGLVVILTLVMLMAMDAAYLPTLLSQIQVKRPSLVAALSGYAIGVRRYMVAATALGVLQSTMNWIALVVLQVPAAFLWALLSFICSFIPNVGYFIAIIPPTIFGFLVGGWPTGVGVILVYGVINFIVQSIVQPLLVSNVVALNQTITFVSVLFWAAVIGPIGAILAVPLSLLVRTILLDADPRMRWFRPLTGDIDEAKDLMKAADAEAKAGRKARKHGSVIPDVPPDTVGTSDQAQTKTRRTSRRT